MLQSREKFLLPIVQVPCELFVRHELGTHHLLFLLGSLILVWRLWECRVLEQVEQVFREVVARIATRLRRRCQSAARKCDAAP